MSCNKKPESMPIAVTLYGNIAIDGRAKSVFDTLYYNNSNVEDFYGYKFSNRLSYFSELILSRKMSEKLSLQAGVSFSHYNTVSSGMDHDRIGIHYGGRMKVSPQGAIILTGDWPLKITIFQTDHNSSCPSQIFHLDMKLPQADMISRFMPELQMP